MSKRREIRGEEKAERLRRCLNDEISIQVPYGTLTRSKKFPMTALSGMREIMCAHAGRQKRSDFVPRCHGSHILRMGEKRIFAKAADFPSMGESDKSSEKSILT